MARPKSTTPTKGRLNLTVSAQTRAELTFVAAASRKSISELVAEWAAKEAKRVSRKTKTPMPDVEQLNIL